MMNAGHGRNAIYGTIFAGIKRGTAGLISFAKIHGRNAIMLRMSAAQRSGIVMMIPVVRMNKNVIRTRINAPLPRAIVMGILTAIPGRNAPGINAN